MNADRMFRDLGDGVIVIDRGGTILSMNPSAVRLLGLERELTGHKYSELMLSAACSENDRFHQVLVDAVTDREGLVSARAPYVGCGGEEKILEVRCSALRDGGNGTREGVILSFSDVTGEERLKEHVVRSAKVFISLLCMICFWVFAYAVWDFSGRPIAANHMSKLLIIFSLIPSLITVRALDLRFSELGLSFRGIRKAVLTDALITAAAFAGMVLLKLVLCRLRPGLLFPEDAPLIVWNKYPLTEWLSYALSVVSQEFITRGVVHECMKRVIPGKNSNTAAILVSSLIFGSLHIHVGLLYMLGAGLLLGALGLVYEKQKSIWGLCIPHYVLGMALGLLDFVVY